MSNFGIPSTLSCDRSNSHDRVRVRAHARESARCGRCSSRRVRGRVHGRDPTTTMASEADVDEAASKTWQLENDIVGIVLICLYCQHDYNVMFSERAVSMQVYISTHA